MRNELLEVPYAVSVRNPPGRWKGRRNVYTRAKETSGTTASFQSDPSGSQAVGGDDASREGCMDTGSA